MYTTKQSNLLMATDLDVDNVEFGSLNKYNYNIGGVSKEAKSVPLIYRSDGVRMRKFMVCIRNCVLKKVHTPKSANDGYSLFLSCEDTNFVDFVTSLEEKLPSLVEENSIDWYDEEYTLEECQSLFSSMLISNDMGVSFSSPCDRRNFKYEFVVDAPEEFDETTPLEDVLKKNYRADVLLELRHVGLGVQSYKVKSYIHQVNVIALTTPKAASNATNVSSFNGDLVSITPLETSTNPVTNMPQKTCKISYNGKPYFNLKMENVSGRMFRQEDTNGKVSYSVALRMDDEHKELFSGVSNTVFNTLKKKSKDYYGKPMTAPLLKKMYNGYPTYGKEDMKLIKAGEDPKYQPTLWLKVYYNPTNGGLNEKFTNGSTEKLITDPDSLCGKDLSFRELTVYNKHIWFGSNTSTNFTISNAVVDFEVESYDMDSKPVVSFGSSVEAETEAEAEVDDTTKTNEVPDSSEDEDEDDE